MDELRRTKTGMHKFPIHPPRRSTGDAATHRTRKPISNEHLDFTDIFRGPGKPRSGDHLDFTDVFGGPPHRLVSCPFPADAYPKSSTTSFVYEEIFQQPRKVTDGIRRNGRSLPEFRIPVQPMREDNQPRNYVKNGFYSDLLGWDDESVKRSRSRSKASSSSVLSSGELSPHCPPVSRGRNNDISSFASKLRPINVTSGWNSRRMVQEDFHDQKYVPGFPGNRPLYDTKNDFTEGMDYPFGSTRRKASPETISMEPMSNNSFNMSADDLELKSPSSSVSSVCQSENEQKNIHQTEEELMRQKSMEEEDDDETASSYVIEINAFDKGEIYEDNGVDEAIAWAKEKFQAYRSESKSKWGGQQCQDEIKLKEEMLNCDQLSEEHSQSSGSQDVEPDKWTTEKESQRSRAQTEMQILDEKIRLWSNGKGSDIRLLLSSLHHILWPSSGWLSIPLMNIMESSQVKKGYQKARLCLHPDKLQQRGATLPQSYIADKVFSILQDAWDSFVAQDC